jgi:hypothetical protein
VHRGWGWILAAAVLWGGSAVAGRSAGAASLIIGKLPVGVRAIGLSGACSAVTGEPSAVWWNPAGLSHVERRRFEMSHEEQGESIRMENVLAAVPLINGGTIGVGFSYMGQPPIVETLEDASGELSGATRSLSVYQYKGAFGFGQDLGKLVPVPELGDLWNKGAVGATITVLGEQIGGSSASAISLDLGYVYEDPNEGRSAGIVVRQIGTPAYGSPIPVTGQAGVGQVIQGVLWTFDVLTAVDDTMRLRGGIEYAHDFGLSTITLRGGAQHSFSSVLLAPFTVGVGYRLKMEGSFDLSIEYAFMPVRGFQDLHAISVQVGL